MNREQVLKAQTIFTNLLLNGKALKELCKSYLDDDIVRELVEDFAQMAKGAIIGAGEYYYFIPLTEGSEYHLSNQFIKEQYLSRNSANIEIYMMYLSMIIFIGEFYNSYTTNKKTRDFLTLADWLDKIDERIESMDKIDDEVLKSAERDDGYNWFSLIEHWKQMDIIKEKTREQKNSHSKRAFLNNTIGFMRDQDMIVELGNDEYDLSMKAQIVVTRFFMNTEYNRGIIDKLYNYSADEDDVWQG